MQMQHSESPRGLVLASTAYLIWGLVLPVYMKLLSHVSPLEIVAQRILWSVPFAFLIIVWQGGLAGFLAVLRQPRTLALAALTATLISINWGVYVYAVIGGHTVDAALGYYITPLVNVVLGAIFLGERPTRAQGVAIALAVAAVVILTVLAGGLPWISLVLPMSFSTYGLLRKVVAVNATEGFLLEVLILSAPALAVCAWLVANGESHFVRGGGEAALLIGAGLVTAVPLILYAAGARLLRYSTIGVLQYIAPTLIFLTAVFAFGEPFSGWQLVAFMLIWAAVAIYIWSMMTAREVALPPVPQGS